MCHGSNSRQLCVSSEADHPARVLSGALNVSLVELVLCFLGRDVRLAVEVPEEDEHLQE